MFTQSRVAATLSATTCASSNAWASSFLRAPGLSTTTSPGLPSAAPLSAASPASAFFFVLYVVYV